MRGKAQVPPVRQRRAGITPAYAGKSRRKGICRRKAWDHPRLCGEKLDVFVSKKCVTGSPPPMRGKVIASLSRGLRITPAYAGKRLILVRIPGSQRDHPRLCGEKHEKVLLLLRV